MIIPTTIVTPIINKDTSLKSCLAVRCIAKTFLNYSPDGAALRADPILGKYQKVLKE